MKNIVLGGILTIFLFTEANCQSLLADWEVKAGLNLFNPEIIRRNESYATTPALGWQIGAGRTLPVTKVLSVHLSGEFAQLNTNLNSPENNSIFFFSDNITMSYIFLNAGVKAEKVLGKFMPFGRIGGRGGLLLDDNLDGVFVAFASRESFDYGLVSSLGSAYSLEKINPFIEVGYYHSLSNITPTGSLNGSGQLFSDEFFNRSWFLSVGIRFN